MKQSHFFLKTLRQAPKEAETISHKLLLRGFFIEQLTSGVWNFLPLGWRVHRKIENIIREEMNAIGGQEISMSVLQPKDIWQKTGRWETMEPPLFKLKDRHNKELALGPTHEEVITLLAKKFIQSYKDLPFALYQIQTKFRNEMRATGGLLRMREFVMKDLYSFHADKKDLDEFYQKVLNAYEIIYERCGFSAIALEAETGSIGGSESHEFMVGADSGEDKILICPMCAWKSKEETAPAVAFPPTPKATEDPPKLLAKAEAKEGKCPECGKELAVRKGIEVGHIFKLGAKYSEALGLYYLDKNGKKQLVEMGCYGIGVGRSMATIVEVYHDEAGIIWPENVAPFKYHLLVFDQDDKKIKDFADEVYKTLIKNRQEVLYDDRDVSAGIKFQDADLIGIPYRLVISQKTGQKIELKKRNEKETKLTTLKDLLK